VCWRSRATILARGGTECFASKTSCVSYNESEREPMNVRDDDLEKYRIFFEKERSEATKGDLLLISLPPLKHGRHNP
jgi:hypothetical protein